MWIDNQENVEKLFLTTNLESNGFSQFVDFPIYLKAGKYLASTTILMA